MPKIETVIYSIEIETANAGAWYKGKIGEIFDCVLVNATIGFSGPEICYKVLGKFEPVKYIRLWHGTVKSQRIATQKELLNRSI